LNEFFVGKDGCIAKGMLTSLKSSSWFLFGESYAGKYVPAIADKWILKAKFTAIDLKGIAIGDGFTDPYNVMVEMPGYGYNLGLIDY
jgi:carboxypeptidase C (cathepsin A)